MEKKKKSKKAKIETIKGKGNALAVVDGQNDFILEDGALYVPGLPLELQNEVIIDHINNLAAMSFDYVAAIKDMHPKRNHIEFDIFGPHCVIMTPGQKHHKDLTWLYEDRADEILIKGMNPVIISHSIAATSHFTQHIENLRLHDIKRIFVAGWAYDYCVGESAIDYARQGFEVYVVRDATRSMNHASAKNMNAKLHTYGVKIIFMNEIG